MANGWVLPLNNSQHPPFTFATIDVKRSRIGAERVPGKPVCDERSQGNSRQSFCSRFAKYREKATSVVHLVYPDGLELVE